MKKLLALLLLAANTALAGSPPFTLPPQGGNAGKVLGTNGTTPGWVVNGSAPPVTSVNSKTGAVVLGTDDIAEGLSNLYFSTALARGAVSASSPLTYSLGVFGCQTASGSQAGCLSSSDWSLFNSKQSTLSFSSPLINTAGTISLPQASASANGYLSSSDWSLFNSKQPAGSYVTTVRSVSTTAPLTGGGTLASDLTLSIPVATSSTSGYLANSDWSLFNGKQSALTFGSIATSTAGVSVGSGANSTVGPNVTVNVQTASGTQPGLLSAADWSTFNGKQGALTLGNLTAGGADGIAVTGGSGSVIGSGTSIAQHVADATHAGYLAAADFTAFNAKQAAGSYLTALTSDVSATGPDSAAATVNSVGGSSAVNVHSAEILANAATSLNTANALIRRDASGNFAAGSATLSGLSVGSLSGVLKAAGGAVSGSATTSDLPEGSNQYYTDTKVQTAIKNGTSAQELYVSKDAGNDANDGSLAHPYKTIGASVTAANSVAAYYKQVYIHVSPINNGGSAGGNYNENVSLTQQGVNLICDQYGPYTRGCVVGGTLTVNLTGTSGGTNFQAASNEVYVLGFVFASGASAAVTFSGTVFQRLIGMFCYFQAGAAQAAVVSNSGTSGGTPSEFRTYDTTFENNSASIETVTISSAARFWLYGMTATVQNKNASGSSTVQSGAGSSMIANFTQFTGQYQLTDNTATATFNLSTIASGTNPCVVTPSSPNTGYALWAYAGCNSSNANAFTGSGIVVFATGNACIGTACSTALTVTTSSLGKMPEGGAFLTGSTGALTSLSTNEIIGYGKTVRAMKIENIVGAASVFTTCTVNPAVTLYDCGTSAGACTSGRTALASVTLTAANTGTNGSVTSATLAAGHYWAMEISAGTCAALNANVSAEGANQ